MTRKAHYFTRRNNNNAVVRMLNLETHVLYAIHSYLLLHLHCCYNRAVLMVCKELQQKRASYLQFYFHLTGSAHVEDEEEDGRVI